MMHKGQRSKNRALLKPDVRDESNDDSHLTICSKQH